jgi:hypothetical protein
MKRAFLILATTIPLTIPAFAGLKLTVDQPLFVAGTKENAKALEGMMDDRDAAGMVAAEDEQVIGEIPAGAVFYVADFDMWGDVDTIRYNGEIDYVPHAELERVTHGKLDEILRNSINDLEKPSSQPTLTPAVITSPTPAVRKSELIEAPQNLAVRARKADLSLNYVYNMLKITLPHQEFLKVRDDEREWLKKTDSLRGEAEVAATEARTEYLQGILNQYTKKVTP